MSLENLVVSQRKFSENDEKMLKGQRSFLRRRPSDQIWENFNIKVNNENAG